MSQRIACRSPRWLLATLLASLVCGAPVSAQEPRAGWPGWRGSRRDGSTARLPAKLPKELRLLWKVTLTGNAPAGVAATEAHVLVADKSEDTKDDVFRCLRASDGKELWKIAYPAPREMDYTNSPRATPLIHQGLVYLLGAFGDLHCVELETGKVVWKQNVIERFGAKLVAWGMCSSPLIVDDKLILNPGAKDASLVALERKTGKLVWKTPGLPSAYSSFVLAELGGVRQIVGYDATTLGGWVPDTGKRLWTLTPPETGDFNVPTPLVLDGQLLVSTEQNGTRLYAFAAGGKIVPEPVATSLALAPDTATPVLSGGLLFGCSGELVCLDPRDGLRRLWGEEREGFDDHVSLVADDERVLVLTAGGELVLYKAQRQDKALVAARHPMQGEQDLWSHPALAGGRLYVRTADSILCFLLEGD